MRERDTIRVILVDDDMDECFLFERAMKTLDINVELSFYHDCAEVLVYLKSTDSIIPHLLFLDINMPLISGMELLIEIRSDKKFINLPIAMYSTSSLQSNIEEALINGANIYITKPNSFEKLQNVLTNILRMQWQFHNSNLSISTFLYTC